MAFVFPDDKNDFLAPNGVTYSWDGTKWVTKTYKKEADGRLPYRLGTDKAARSARLGEPAIELVDAEDNYSNVKFFGVNGIDVESTISGIKVDGHQLIGAGDIDLTAYATIEYSDTEDAKLQNQIDDLSVSKGKVARYKVENTIGTPVARPGQLSFNTTFPNNVVLVSFGVEDLDGVLTKPMATGDIIEFVNAASSKVSRYRITDAAGAPTGVGVEYISGDNYFVKDEEQQVYIYPQNESGASKDYVDAQDALHLPLTGGTLSGAVVGPAFKGLKASGPVITVGTANDNIKALIHANGLGEFANGKINGVLNFQRGKDSPQFKISPNSSDTDWATNIYSLNGGNMRFRTSHTGNEGDHVGSHIILDSAGGVPETKIYHVVTPTNDHMAASKGYVDAQGGGVPVGCIMIWMNSDAPPGWFKLQGGSFDTAANPNLHAYLQGTTGYVAGKLPDWSGRYPGNYGDHINNPLGSKQNQKTAMPSGGAPYHPNSIPNGNTRTFNGSGGTNAYSDGIARPAITEGWDSVTRPPTVVVHYIIKGG
ncbi:hypothetical protein [uncultured phage MedDCM-OCT-S09-C28]|nr:hypothetical protein [uncultured phage MedDCM-OCT-S09-C28]